MPSPIFSSRPSPGFSLHAVANGVLLSVQGIYKTIQNPLLRNDEHYVLLNQTIKQSFISQITVWVPVFVLKSLVGSLISFYNDDVNKLNTALETIIFIQDTVLNPSLFFITSATYFNPDFNGLFLTSIQFLDNTSEVTHGSGKSNRYYPGLVRREKSKPQTSSDIRFASRILKKVGLQKINDGGLYSAFLIRYLQRAGLSLAVLLISYTPIIGKFLISSILFSNINGIIGTTASVPVFLASLLVPSSWVVILITTLWCSESLVEEIFNLYFSRVPFSRDEKRQWVKAREGILYGFGLTFLLLLKIPFIGVVVYGIAESTSGYIITKITEPVPILAKDLVLWIPQEILWINKPREFTEPEETFVDASNWSDN